MTILVLDSSRNNFSVNNNGCSDDNSETYMKHCIYFIVSGFDVNGVRKVEIKCTLISTDSLLKRK